MDSTKAMNTAIMCFLVLLISAMALLLMAKSVQMKEVLTSPAK
jgi:hypothetical protein